MNARVSSGDRPGGDDKVERLADVDVWDLPGAAKTDRPSPLRTLSTSTLSLQDLSLRETCVFST